MVFSSTLFLFCFLPVTLAGYYISILIDKKVFGSRKEFSNYWLLIMSLLFFAWSQLNYVWIILLSICINYVGAMGIEVSRGAFANKIHAEKAHAENPPTEKSHAVTTLAEKSYAEKTYAKKLCLFVTVAANLLLLFYFKYFDFAIDTINQVLNRNIPLRNIVLPIGISFFTFQAMSYTCDVYMGRARVQRNPFKRALYVMLFPQLIAGPIVRYTDVESEIDDRHVTVDDFAAGARRFIVGLGKKALIANTMAVTVDSIWAQGIQNNTVSIAWLGAIAYSLQIYFDFSGYSDMAIGLGRMFGFHFLENFNLPYISRSITEFWRRWHISLSSWFRDYVYIPLGGNRHGVFKTYRNLFIIFLLTGIWHGAAWHYIFWGIWHGAFMLIERTFRGRDGARQHSACDKKNGADANIAEAGTAIRPSVSLKIVRVIQHIYTLLIVVIGWIFFRANSLSEALWYLKTMLGRALGSEPGFSVTWYLDRWTILMLIVGVIFSTEIPSYVTRIICGTQVQGKAKSDKGDNKELNGAPGAENTPESNSAVEIDDAIRTQDNTEISGALREGAALLAGDIGLLLILALASMSIVSGTYNPFIYFQF